MKKSVIVLIAVIAVIAIAAGSCISAYNGLAAERENVENAASNIDTQLQRRMDLIPNLVETVKGLSAHEQEIIDSVTDARSKLAGAQSMEEKAAADSELSSALSRLLVVVENYPQIQSSSAYISLMDELSGTENRINVAREDYNSAVKTYNAKIVTFPRKLIASLFGFEKADYYQASEGAQNAPSVDFAS